MTITTAYTKNLTVPRGVVLGRALWGALALAGSGAEGMVRRNVL